MNNQENVELEFEVGIGPGDLSIQKKGSVTDVTRNLFRVPLNGLCEASVQIGEREYLVLDFSGEGIAIRPARGVSNLHPGAIVDMHLALSGEDFDLKSQVAHFSLDENGTGFWGMRFLEVDRQTQHRLMALYGELRKQFLSH